MSQLSPVRRKSVRNESNAARNASSMSVNGIAIGSRSFWFWYRGSVLFDVLLLPRSKLGQPCRTEIATASADLRQQRGDRVACLFNPYHGTLVPLSLLSLSLYGKHGKLLPIPAREDRSGRVASLNELVVFLVFHR